MLTLVLLGCLSGCQQGDGLIRATVSGAVSYDGSPAETGSIAFIPVEGTSGPTVGTTIQGGKFEVPESEGPVPGVYRIEIRATRVIGKMKVPQFDTEDSPLMEVDKTEMYIPRKYNLQSTLQETIELGENVMKFDLEP